MGVGFMGYLFFLFLVSWVVGFCGEEGVEGFWLAVELEDGACAAYRWVARDLRMAMKGFMQWELGEVGVDHGLGRFSYNTVNLSLGSEGLLHYRLEVRKVGGSSDCDCLQQRRDLMTQVPAGGSFLLLTYSLIFTLH